MQRRERKHRPQQRQRCQHPRKPRNHRRIDQRADDGQRRKNIAQQYHRQHRRRPLSAYSQTPAAFFQTTCRSPNQGGNQTERQPSADAQNRQRIEQQHHRQSLPPRRPARRQTAAPPSPGKRRQHQNTALRRHGKARQQRIKQSPCRAARQNPHARFCRYPRQSSENQFHQPTRQHRHHRNVQPRNTDQVRQTQRSERLPQFGPQRRLFAYAQSPHQTDTVRKIRTSRPDSLPTAADCIAPHRQADTAALANQAPDFAQRTRAIQTVCQRPSLAVQPAQVHFADNRLEPCRHLPAAAHRPIAFLIIRQQ